MDDPRVVVFHDDEDALESIADGLSGGYAVDTVLVDDGIDGSWNADAFVVWWSLPREVRESIRSMAREGDGRTFVVAIVEGVPPSDPRGEGADIYVGSESQGPLRATLELLLLQRDYQGQMTDLVSLSRDLYGTDREPEREDVEELSRLREMVDDSLDLLVEEVPYTGLYRRLFADQGQVTDLTELPGPGTPPDEESSDESRGGGSAGSAGSGADE